LEVKVKLNVGVGVWIDEYQKNNTNIIRLFNEFVQRNQATKELLSLVVSQEKLAICNICDSTQNLSLSLVRSGQGEFFWVWEIKFSY
jgi:hypothetical protein